MSYRIYHTDGYIIDSNTSGESGKVFTILTHDLGTIVAIAQGVRKLQSKLRCSLQDLSYGKFAFVRGKDIWRITGAEKIVNIYDKKVPIQVRQSLARILAFIKRLSPGENVNKLVFSEFNQLHKALLSAKMIRSASDLVAIENLALLRIAHHFGYGTINEKIRDIVYASKWNEEIRDLACGLNKNLEEELGIIIRETQL